MKTKLNLGCGRKRIADAVNVDIASAVEPDVVLDLNQRPWPFTDNQFHEVEASEVIEHCDDVVAVMEEIHRVCAPGALLRITVPHFSSPNAYADPTHQHQFTSMSFDYFTDRHEFSFYSNARFKRLTANIVFHPSLVNKIVWRVANRYPESYERRWAWIFPAWFLYFELEVVKKSP